MDDREHPDREHGKGATYKKVPAAPQAASQPICAGRQD